LESLPDLPVCNYLDCKGCTSLTSLPDLPVCATLVCEGCISLAYLPDLPVCTYLYCSGCVNLTHISVQDRCEVDCIKSPIAKYNNNLYLPYISVRGKVITTAMRKSHNYEQGIVGIIAGYL
jgi:hypothetical protein